MVKVLALLSGGLDSRLVVKIMQELVGKKNVGVRQLQVLVLMSPVVLGVCV